MKQLCKKIILVFILGQLVMWPSFLSFADEAFKEKSTESLLYIRGIVRSVSVEKMQVVVKPLKGKRIVVDIELNTIVEGVSRIENIKKEQQVKVWYKIDDDRNTVVKIKKMIDLGC